MKNLLDNIDELKKLIVQKNGELLLVNEEIKALKNFIDLLRKKNFSPKSEVISKEQLGIFNEVEANSEIPEKERTEPGKSPKKRRPRLSETIPRETVVIDLPESEKFCSVDGSPLKEFGEEVSEKLVVVPARVFVKRILRKKYACPKCDEGLKTAPGPVQLLPKSVATPSLLSHIIISKYQDGLPLYRQEEMFRRMGAEISWSSMARWLIEISKKLVPIYNLLEDKLLTSNYVQIDETHVKVIAEKKKSKSFMWVRYCPGNSPIVLYDYFPSRSGEIPKRLMEGFSGHLQCDGYGGYDSFFREKEGVKRIGCMDHSRRKFFDAFKAAGEKGPAGEVLILMKKLYDIERKVRGLSSSKIANVRDLESRPVFKELVGLIESLSLSTAPKSPLGKAVSYFIKESKNLERYLEDPILNISNVGVENKIRPFVIGRKNWLFSASSKGAEASAMFYSLIETAKANGMNPNEYFEKLLIGLPNAKFVEDFETLLPRKFQSFNAE